MYTLTLFIVDVYNEMTPVNELKKKLKLKYDSL